MVRRFKPTTQRAIHVEADMKLAVVTDNQRHTVAIRGLAHDKLLMVEMIVPGQPRRAVLPSYRQYRGGTGSGYCWSAAVPHAEHRSEFTGRSVRRGIVDEVVAGGKVVFHK